MSSTFIGFVSVMVLDHMMNLSQTSLLKAWASKNAAQKELEFILSELEEAIITKDSVKNRITYANKRAKEIMTKISHD